MKPDDVILYSTVMGSVCLFFTSCLYINDLYNYNKDPYNKKQAYLSGTIIGLTGLFAGSFVCHNLHIFKNK